MLAGQPVSIRGGSSGPFFGVAGCLACRASHGFRAATVLVNAIFLLGNSVGYVRRMTATGNFASGNDGPAFSLDITLHVATVTLLILTGELREDPPRHRAS
jgi:hypothetical protein